MSKMFKSIKEIVKEYKKFFIYFISFSILLCLIDQVSKWIALNLLGPLESKYPSGYDLPSQYGSSVEVIPGFLNFTLLTNNGAAFGMGAGKLYMRIIFIIISWVFFLGVPFGIIYYFKKNKKDINIMYKIALILLYGGNFGNLIDRTFYWSTPCGVIDFIDITPLINGFGIFNLADSFVVIAVIIVIIMLIIDIFKGNDEENDKNIKEVDTEKDTNKETLN